MIGMASSTSAPLTYICNWLIGGIQSQLSSVVTVARGRSSNTTSSEYLFFDSLSYMTSFDHQSSSNNSIRINDLLVSQRRRLYDMLACSTLDDDSQPLAYFEEMRNANDDYQCFGQIMKIFLGAYKKKDDLMIVKILRFMQNFSYSEIREVGISAVYISLRDNKSLDIQSAALSLILRWKSEEFRSVLASYHVPKDPFIKVKIKKLSAWYTSEK